ELICVFFFFFSSRRRHTRSKRDWSSVVCSSDLLISFVVIPAHADRDDDEGDQGPRGARPRLQAHRLPPGDRQVSKSRSAPKNGYEPRLKTTYEQEVKARLKDELGLSSVMQVPRVQKITLNMGVGEAKTEAKALDGAIEELTT